MNGVAVRRSASDVIVFLMSIDEKEEKSESYGKDRFASPAVGHC